ncbi:MAG: ATP-binding cassette domain-containing protein [Burkholderiaceae bacterium]
MIEFSQVHKSYGPEQALAGITFTVNAGEMVFVAGHSGAGKTTLLKLIAGIERPTVGSVVVRGQNVGSLRASGIPYLRRNLGLIFQDQKLLTDRSVFANVLLPLVVVGTPPRDAAKRARAALDKVGLLDREKASPLALSGGDQQRLAIARAIVNRPAIVLADEPTANLDRQAARRIIDVFRQFNQVGVTILIATHDERLFDGLNPRLLRLAQGRISAQVAPDGSSL